ncbi:MAG: zinc ribbon domain-containing protein [Chloroflexi bacterium]|nr:zinc ribbon domain-containing protein [Chloroflexota bacterium]
MPVYEYYCSKCQKEFELMRRMSQFDQPALCPTCGAEGSRLVSACAAKVDFYVRPAAKPPFRQHVPSKTGKPDASSIP